MYNDAGQRVRKVVDVTESSSSSGGSITRVLRDTIIVQGAEFYIKYKGQGSIALQSVTVQVSDGQSTVARVERWSGADSKKKKLPPILYRIQYQSQCTNFSLELNEKGQPLSLEENSPFGGQMYYESLASSRKRYGYSDKERDKETGLLYFGKRYYIPWLCRWLNPDPLGTVAGLNAYQYVRNNPIMLHDPDGRIEKKQIKKLDKKNPKSKVLHKKKEKQARASYADFFENTTNQNPGLTATESEEKLAKGAEDIRTHYNPNSMHKSHLIPGNDEIRGNLAPLIDTDSWCVRTEAWVNLGPMREKLDKPWTSYFAEIMTSKTKGSNMTRMQFFIAVGKYGSEAEKLRARNMLLAQCQSLCENNFFPWKIVLSYRIHYDEKIFPKELDLKAPAFWTDPNGSNEIKEGPRSDIGTHDFVMGQSGNLLNWRRYPWSKDEKWRSAPT